MSYQEDPRPDREPGGDGRFGDWDDTTIRISRPLLCDMCRHATDKVRWRCTAFPNGIPNAITSNEHVHTDPFPGDGGIRFAYDWSKEHLKAT